jgi:hypothetical protein
MHTPSPNNRSVRNELKASVFSGSCHLHRKSRSHRSICASQRHGVYPDRAPLGMFKGRGRLYGGGAPQAVPRLAVGATFPYGGGGGGCSRTVSSQGCLIRLRSVPCFFSQRLSVLGGLVSSASEASSSSSLTAIFSNVADSKITAFHRPATSLSSTSESLALMSIIRFEPKTHEVCDPPHTEGAHHELPEGEHVYSPALAGRSRHYKWRCGCCRCSTA